MADLSITAASVLAGSNASVVRGLAGETVTQGQIVYLDSTTNEYMLADADAASDAARGSGVKTGVALNGASNAQPLSVAVKGDITIGATLTAGTDYYLSATAGGICPRADLTTGDYVVLLGLASSTSVLKLDIQYSGVETA